MELLTEQSAPQYLVELGLISADEPVTVETLAGGISNIVLGVETTRHDWVIKQALPKLRVAADWPSDVRRALREADCMVALRDLIGSEHVPTLIHADEQRCIIVMTRMPREMEVWKAQLLAGQVNVETARRVGVLLNRIQKGSRNNASLLNRFGDKTNFYQLRVSPYHEATGARHPDLHEQLERVCTDLMQAEEVLVHGDYSPKNMLVYGSTVVLLDHEVVHYGHPAFDPAFCLNHLLLKSIRFSEWRAEYLAAAQAFLDGYSTNLPDLSFHLGWLMLARIDGKSPVEYITTDEIRTAVRVIACRLILETPPIETALLYVAETSPA